MQRINSLPTNVVMALELYNFTFEAYREMVLDSHRRANPDHPVLSKYKSAYTERKQIFMVCTALCWDVAFQRLGEKPTMKAWKDYLYEEVD